MSALAVVMMVVICGTIWGGFATLLARALMRERGKGGEGD
jgi:hypothetical protein